MNIGISLTSSLDIDNSYIDLTENVAKSIAQKGWGIVYGGTYYGMMKKLADTYKQSNGQYLVGVMAKDLILATKNYQKYENLDVEYLEDTMENRKRKIIELSDAYIILPGGWGTFEEIGSVLGGQANKLYSKPIAFLNLDNFYNDLLAFLDKMYRNKFSRVDPRKTFYSSDNINSILEFFEKYSAVKLPDKFA